MTDEVMQTPPSEPTGSTETVSVETPDTPVLDVSQYSEYRVPVKLDGEELQVPLSEAIAGYQRQADYTRKTQELAQEREQYQFASALQAALESDPQGTINLLAEHYGITRQQAADMVADGSFDEELDPTERKYRELDKRIASFEEQQTRQQIEAEVARLRSKYEDFNVQEVVTAAIKAGTNDLEGTYKQIAFDRIMAKNEVERQAREKQKAAENAVVESKRQAAVVSGGASATQSTTTESFEPITSVRDAYIAAKRQMGG